MNSAPPKIGIRAMEENNLKKRDSKKIRKIERKLKTLYPEYRLLNFTKTNQDKLDHLIDTISKLEYKYIKHLKKR